MENNPDPLLQEILLDLDEVFSELITDPETGNNAEAQRFALRRLLTSAVLRTRERTFDQAKRVIARADSAFPIEDVAISRFGHKLLKEILLELEDLKQRKDI